MIGSIVLQFKFGVFLISMSLKVRHLDKIKYSDFVIARQDVLGL